MSFLSYTVLFVQALLIAAVTIYLNAPLWLIIFAVGQTVALSLFFGACIIRSEIKQRKVNYKI